MTLRLRMVLALVALVTVAAGAFLAATYLTYEGSQYRELDAQLHSAAPLVDQYLDAEAGQGGGDTGAQPAPGARIGLGPGPLGQPGRAEGHAPGLVLPPGTVAELVSPTGTVVAHVQFTVQQAQPGLPTHLPPPSPQGRIFTVGATSGSAQFRVLQVAAANGGSTIVAIPTTDVTKALDRLLLIEGAALAALLVVVSAGAWLVLRRGLQPLERMAQTAGRISAGDLSQRVDPSGGTGEVPQLGMALNSMLDGIETAFAERDATEKRLRQFLADASHELRTPLTSIQGFAELFRVSGDSAQVDLPTILRRIEEESARMRVLVEDLLLLARLDQHRDMDRRPTDLVVLAADACTDAVATDPSRPITLDAPEPVLADVDQGQIRQAIANLVTNALRHTPPGTPIEVGCRTVEASAVITVRDHGPGLDAESLQHAFDRFWQGDKARVGTGAGLGLSIVAAIAVEHGGRAEAANAPGGGAVFTVAIPLPSKSQAEAGRSASGIVRPDAVPFGLSGDGACARTPSPRPT